MSIGSMTSFIKILKKVHIIDEDGFSLLTEVTKANVRALKEGRHGSEKWANFAVFSEATVLFRIRVIPGLEVTPKMIIICDSEYFEITSIENIKNKGMYLEILCKEVKPSG